MKFGNTGRDITDKQKFMTKKKNTSFLDRFKGRTLQLGKEGHLGIVKHTNMPIKAIHDDPSQSYSNINHGKSAMKHKNGGDTVKNVKPKNNFEALLPLKRSNSINNDHFEQSNNRYESFARNFNKNSNSLAQSYNPSGGLRKGLANAGSNVLRNSFSNSVKDNFSKMGSSHSTGVLQPGNGPALRNPGTKFCKKPTNSSHNPQQAYSSMKQPAAVQNNLRVPCAKNVDNVSKSSFYSEPKTSNYRKKLDVSHLNGSKSPGLPYGSSSASNSNGFMNTAVSTPFYGGVSMI